MRHLKAEAWHAAPFLDDLFEQASEHLPLLGDLSVLTLAERTTRQNEALTALWNIFLRLPVSGFASCVGITKAVLLGLVRHLTLKSARSSVWSDQRPVNDWLLTLQGIGEDIAMFESTHGPLAKTVPIRFAGLAYGRLYDMALGPRGRPASI